MSIDIHLFRTGDILSADGIIVQCSDLKIDESALTGRFQLRWESHASCFTLSAGETDLIKKSEEDDVGLLSGTQVMEGSGRMVITGVGLNSQVGAIMSLLGVTGGGGDSKKSKKAKSKAPGKAPATTDAGAKEGASKEGQVPSQEAPLTTAANNGGGDGKKIVEAAQGAKNDVATTAPALKDVVEDEPTGKTDSKQRCKQGDSSMNSSEVNLSLSSCSPSEIEHFSLEYWLYWWESMKFVSQTETPFLGLLGMGAAAVTLICLITRFCITTYWIRKQRPSTADIMFYVSFLVQAITVVVVAVPEGDVC